VLDLLRCYKHAVKFAADMPILGPSAVSDGRSPGAVRRATAWPSTRLGFRPDPNYPAFDFPVNPTAFIRQVPNEPV
jgi:hypothetical protein